MAMRLEIPSVHLSRVWRTAILRLFGTAITKTLPKYSAFGTTVTSADPLRSAVRWVYFGLTQHDESTETLAGEINKTHAPKQQ